MIVPKPPSVRLPAVCVVTAPRLRTVPDAIDKFPDIVSDKPKLIPAVLVNVRLLKVVEAEPPTV